MELLVEPERIETDQGPIVLLHGDALCTDDVAYQRFRKKARDPAWQRRMLSRPVWWRRMLARLARMLSRRHTGSREPEIMDVNDQAVADFFRAQDARRIIHGHTHRRAIHDFSVDNRHCQRIVLGDWHAEGSTVRIDESGIAMLTIARDSQGDVELRLQETAAPLAD